MQPTEEVSHLSIGEVLSLLQSDFPDITISKIRFLEGQGLIDPERTPSGYRKFYEIDIVRLRWILRQQRDFFLPLKVIKAKLDQGGPIDFTSDAAIQPSLWTESGDSAVAGHDGAAQLAAVEASTAGAFLPKNGREERIGRSESTIGKTLITEPTVAPSASDTHAVDAGRSAAAASTGDESRDAAAWLAALQESPVPAGLSGQQHNASSPGESSPSVDVGGPRIGRSELSELTGVDAEGIESMITFGLLTPMMIGGEATFDAASIAVVKGVKRFLDRGVEPRHLKMFKNAADREAGFYEQMILPLLKQRNPRSREQATESLAELMRAGDELGRSLIRQALRSHLGE